MVLAAALHQSRHDHDDGGVYLFAPDFPEYDRRMEVISLLTKMWMRWESEFTLAPRD